MAQRHAKNIKPSGDLSAEQRAEDILLGGLGFGEDARLIGLEITPEGFRARVQFPDGEQAEASNEDPLSELEQWALTILRALAASG